MKKIIITLAAVAALALTGCDAIDQAVLTDDIGDGKVDSVQPVIEEPAAAVAAPAEVTSDTIPDFWYLYPDRTDESLCNGLYPTGLSIPCKDVLDVCVVHEDGYISSKWIPEWVRCTAEYPTREDVCRVAPPEQWAFYGYTPEWCATVLAP